MVSYRGQVFQVFNRQRCRGFRCGLRLAPYSYFFPGIRPEHNINKKAPIRFRRFRGGEIYPVKGGPRFVWVLPQGRYFRGQVVDHTCRLLRPFVLPDHAFYTGGRALHGKPAILDKFVQILQGPNC